MGYTYKADVYCNGCGNAIKSRLHNKPEDELDYSSYDSDDYPKHASVEREPADCPQHCGGCGEFLHNPLTTDGYEYVQAKLNATGRMSMYQGNVSIVLKEWASWYGFTYWTVEDCQDDGQHTEPGWYSNEV